MRPEKITTATGCRISVPGRSASNSSGASANAAGTPYIIRATHYTPSGQPLETLYGDTTTLTERSRAAGDPTCITSVGS